LNRYFTMKSLEGLLESFIENVVHLKQERLQVLEGINRLDDIARLSTVGSDVSDEIGQWFAEHSQWLGESVLQPAEAGRIGKLLDRISHDLGSTVDDSPERHKIETEIDRWNRFATAGTQKLVLKRAAETKPKEEQDSISLFDNILEKLIELYRDKSDGKKHLMSVLDDTLKSATLQRNKEALLLSGFILYYLKQNGYMVEPFVKRLKETERLLKGEDTHV